MHDFQNAHCPGQDATPASDPKMPDLLLEIFSEEIPARMQRRAAEDLKTLVTDGLVKAGLTYEGAKSFCTPRRLALTVNGLTAQSPDRKDERKGPRVGAPAKALEGFVKGSGLSSIDDAKIRTDPKKGDFYVAVIEQKGKNAQEIISILVPDVIAKFPWPKSMRWASKKMRWVRPLHSIVCTLGSDLEETEIVNFTIEGITSSNLTRGHRFLSEDTITVKRFDDYVVLLEKNHVILDQQRRIDNIKADCENLAFAQGFELVNDAALLEEVSGLVEWPVVLMGCFDQAYLELPDEVIQTTIRENQKCFVLRDPSTGKLANRFLLISNLEATDGGETIIKGNEKVIHARLADARFFWNVDLKTKLETRVPRLNSVIFHKKLGTQLERVKRICALAETIAPMVNANPDLAKRAALLSKADLTTDMVYEFPELQGLMGRYYASIEGEDDQVSHAIEDHYKPLGPSDTVPHAPVTIAVGLADKIDMLTGFWHIGEKPTGSKDPFALRRAALGVIRLIVGNECRLSLLNVFQHARENFDAGDDLLAFFTDRLKVHLKDNGARHDLIDAVLGVDNQDDLFMVTRRVSALGDFLATEDGLNLKAGLLRANNILKAEEKKSSTKYSGHILTSSMVCQEEKTLATEIAIVRDSVSAAIEKEDFATAMSALAGLRGPVDAFFDNVMVNDNDAAIRENRLNLLASIRNLSNLIADFSKISG